ncbi:MAG: ABC transporter ATP-binding protein [Betaproteobacteria bacterium]
MRDALRIENLSAGYGEAIVLSDISLVVPARSALAVLGRNGTGKTTLLNSIIGHTRHRAGTVWLNGRDITGLRPDQRARAGIGWGPQERGIFKSLTVVENLTAVARDGAWTPERVFQTFPRLGERKGNFGNQLSGGEQQMLAIGRALVVNPGLLLLDEPLEGLAPLIVEELLGVLRRIMGTEDMAVVIVEQNARKILPETSRAIILERGAVAYEGASAELAADSGTLERLLGVAR